MNQVELFTTGIHLPEGFLYQRDFISPDEEQSLIAEIEKVEFAEIKMHGVTAKRRAAHFGRDYEYQKRQISRELPIPQFLLPLRRRVADLAGRKPEEFAEVLVTDYPPGAGIGWHRDAPGFDIVVGVSLLSECTMQFRRWPVQEKLGSRSKTLRQLLERHSVYILRGPSRSSWQHHIAATKSRRYSITLRTLRGSF